MTQNFLELFIIEPLPATTFHSPEARQDFQWILSQCVSGKGAISFAFRQSITHPNRLLFVSCWNSKADHDDLDLRGVTPKMLKTLMSRIGVPPIAVYYLLMDEEDRKKVDFDVDALEMTAWYVSDGCRGDFQREAESNRVRRAWYVNKGVPPRPLVMPADPVEVKMIEEGEKRAQARLEMPTPDIWISFSTGGLEDRLEEFGDAVKGYVSKVESGKYEKFLSG